MKGYRRVHIAGKDAGSKREKRTRETKELGAEIRSGRRLKEGGMGGGKPR